MSSLESQGIPDGLTRRRWLQLMGASLALSAAGGCRWEREEILPFADRPPDRVPGKPQRFATAMDRAGVATGLLVTAVDGRPVKIEGNPRHPQSRGATDAAAQAAILQLYDPDRSRNVYRIAGGKEIVQTWEDFAEFARRHFAQLLNTNAPNRGSAESDDDNNARGGQSAGKQSAGNGAGFHVLAEADSSPTLAALRERLLKTFPNACWHEYEPISRDNERSATGKVFGTPLRPHLALDKARVILCLDADLFGSHPAAVRYAGDFAAGREVVAGRMNRLYAVESRFSITGAAADHRLPLRSDRIGTFVSRLAAELKAISGGSNEAGAEPGESQQVARLLRAGADDLWAHRGQGIVAVGYGQPAEVHQAVAAINGLLGNIGKTITYTPDSQPRRSTHLEAIRSLAAELSAGKVHTLLILGGNPVYNAPVDLDFAAALGKVETSIHLSLYRNETSRRCGWHVPKAHFLEAWGDSRAYDGTYSVVQPLIEPLYGGKSSIEMLATVLGGQSPDARLIVRETFKQLVGGDDWQGRWRQTVHDGLLADSAVAAVTPPAEAEWKAADLAAGPLTSEPDDEPLEIVFAPDASVYDGRFANNGWLQEMPDPMTRITWENAALISPATAGKLGVEDQTLVRLTYQGRSLEMPVCVMPGQAPGSVAVQLGYGRTEAGHVGGSESRAVEPAGFDTYKLRTSRAMHFGTGLSVEPTGKRYPLASTQEHFAIDPAGMKGRAERVGTLIREATLEHYREHPDFAAHAVHHPPLESLWEEHGFEGHRWAMAIDLSKCTGCGACVVACQAENNVPIVGRQRVIQGREMHWLRVERYFKGDPDQPQAVVQPVACQQCELAPCEQVCPVAATVHSKEGLNDMVYNRCVGTRYCANNCPYKVRRFNFFNYHKNLADPSNEVTKMMYNPEVTVRSRGVMEKCTYCVQRIQAARIEAKGRRQPITDGQIQTACQQVCPTGAIVFGDLADERSRVARAYEADRAYGMLAELNVKPRTTYLARIRNPNPQLL